MSRLRGRVYPRVKRAIDVAVSGVGLVLVAPVMGAVAIAVRRDLGSPVLFRQIRPGKNGRLFELVKFRTMRQQIADEGDVDRITPLGRWLRSTSLDELPTLWNVLRGDMSLVGPRPLMVAYLPRYTPMQARRHDVRPGITGLAQIRGRNALSWEDKFAADCEYVEGLSFGLDVKVLLATVTVVLSKRGISASPLEPMPEFLGVAPEEPAGTDGPGAGPESRDASEGAALAYGHQRVSPAAETADASSVGQTVSRDGEHRNGGAVVRHIPDLPGGGSAMIDADLGRGRNAVPRAAPRSGKGRS